jgi:hypothetical protein
MALIAPNQMVTNTTEPRNLVRPKFRTTKVGGGNLWWDYDNGVIVVRPSEK